MTVPPSWVGSEAFPVPAIDALKATGYTTKRAAEFDEKSPRHLGRQRAHRSQSHRSPGAKHGELSGGHDSGHHFGKAAGY